MITTIDRTEALKLIGRLATATIRAYRATNESTRLSAVKAYRQEQEAARKLFTALTGESANDDEIDQALQL